MICHLSTCLIQSLHLQFINAPCLLYIIKQFHILNFKEIRCYQHKCPDPVTRETLGYLSKLTVQHGQLKLKT
jgi:hypothetical protein